MIATTTISTLNSSATAAANRMSIWSVPHPSPPLLRQIRPRGDHQGLGARGQRWLDDRREEFRMIDGDILLHPPGRERALVFFCVDAADSPVGVRRAQGVRDIAEVFAGGLMAEVEERAGREMASERGRGLLRDVWVVIGERVLIVVVEFRRLR